MWIDDGHGCVERIPSTQDFNRPRWTTNTNPNRVPTDQLQRRHDVCKRDPATYLSPYKESWPYSYNPYFGLITRDFA